MQQKTRRSGFFVIVNSDYAKFCFLRRAMKPSSPRGLWRARRWQRTLSLYAERLGVTVAEIQ